MSTKHLKSGRGLSRNFMMRLSDSDVAELRATAEAACLPVAEIARRCVRIGHEIIRREGVVGSPIMKKEKERLRGQERAANRLE